MKRNKINNLILTFAAVLLCLTLLSTYMVSGLYARYTVSSEGSDSARVAKFVYDIKNGSTGEDIEIDKITKPGDSQKLMIEVTNTKNSVTSEVAESCAITVEYIGSMPIVIELLDGTDSLAELNAKDITEDNQLISSETPGTSMKASVETSKVYTLSINWPIEENDIKYANAASCGKIILTINGEQID